MVFWCLVLTIILNLLIGLTADGSTHWLSYLSIICVIGYIVGFAVGPGPIPWIMNAEFFTQAARPPATMLSCVANWTCNFLIGIGFPAVAVSLFQQIFSLLISTFTERCWSLCLPRFYDCFFTYHNLFTNSYARN